MNFEGVGAGLTTIVFDLTQMRLNPPRLDLRFSGIVLSGYLALAIDDNVTSKSVLLESDSVECRDITGYVW
ncbi:hypothetical protein [Coleofasciculus chthonoplastes]|uniref:hypothetical protein n=1 Tax=Coleofasciculus chthonoplastes TaxID=64178 RepID=UPI0032FB75CC